MSVHLHIADSDGRASIVIPASLVSGDEDVLFGGPPPRPAQKVTLSLRSSTDTVSAWLHENGFEAYCTQFSANCINGEAFSNLTLDQLKELGVTKIGHLNQLAARAAELRMQNGASFIADHIYTCFQWQLSQLSQIDNQAAQRLLQRVQSLTLTTNKYVPVPPTHQVDPDLEIPLLGGASFSSPVGLFSSSSNSSLVNSIVSPDHFQAHVSEFPSTPMMYRTLRWRRGLGDMTVGQELAVLTAQRERCACVCIFIFPCTW